MLATQATILAKPRDLCAHHGAGADGDVTSLAMRFLNLSR